MTVKEVMIQLEELAPLAYSEEFDNTGLLVGNANTKVNGILVTLDTLEAVVDEAIKKNCNLIVSFHPIIFSGLKKITGKTYVERVVLKAIKNDINIIAVHTALDNSFVGVNAMICQTLGLKNRNVLIPKKETIKKLVTYVPNDEVELVKNALFKAGAGTIGNYDNCSFTTGGFGSFKGDENSNPVKGKQNELITAPETQIHVTFPKHCEHDVLNALHQTHSYEEVAFEVTTLENTNQHLGMGMIGELPNEINGTAFLELLKEKMNTDCVRHTSISNKKIKKVAVLGGSGSFAIKAAIANGADAYVTSDLKYHDFFSAEGKILLADIGHYESEQYTKDLLYEFLSKKITTFAVVLSQTNTNPISYF